jgi:hypothetical protein
MIKEKVKIAKQWINQKKVVSQKGNKKIKRMSRES